VRYALNIIALSGIVKFLGDSPAAIPFFIPIKYFSYLLLQFFVFTRSVAWLSLLPRIITASAYFQHAAEQSQFPLTAMSFYKPIPFFFVLLK
jgi:hypothetical protein